MMPVGWSIRVLSLNWIRLTVPELGRLQFSIDRQLKVPIFTFFGRKGGQILNLIFLTPKRHYVGGLYTCNSNNTKSANINEKLKSNIPL